MFSGIMDALRGRQAVDRPLTPPGFSGAVLPVVDADEGGGAVADISGPERRAFIITYRDASGGRSERRIICHGVYEAEGLTYVRARCLERQASRTFRVDRISAVYCGVTGEDLGRSSVIFAATELRAATPKPDDMTAGLQRATAVLMTLARSDGRLHPKEADVVWRFVDTAAPLGFSRADRSSIQERALRLAPMPSAFLDDLLAILRWTPLLVEPLLHSSVELAEADGRVAPEEIEILKAMVGLFQANGVNVTLDVVN